MLNRTEYRLLKCLPKQDLGGMLLGAMEELSEVDPADIREAANSLRKLGFAAFWYEDDLPIEWWYRTPAGDATLEEQPGVLP